jgi:anti-anti-sigma factor
MTHASGLDVRVRPGTQHTTIQATGDIDLATAPELRAALLEAVERGTTVLDLAGVSFLDSSGLRVLAEAHHHAAAHASALRIVAPSEAVTYVFRLAAPGFFETYPDASTALETRVPQPV